MQQANKFGIKFKNKSEEERYMKICTKIVKSEYMNQVQLNLLSNAVEKFLKDYIYPVS